MRTITERQKFLLKTINEDNGQDTHALGQVIRKKYRDSVGNEYDRTRAMLVKLEKRGLIRRQKEGRTAATWYITAAGLGEIED
jgi:hypothetical protein